MPRNSKTLPLVIFVLLLVAALVVNITMLAPYLLALFMGLILTVLCRPAYDWARRKGLSPQWASGLVVLGLLLLIVGPIGTVFTVAVRQGIALVTHLTQERELSFGAMVDLLARWPLLQEVVGDRESIEQNVRTAVQNGGRFLSGFLLGLLGKIPDLVIQLFVAVFTCFFLLIDGKRLVVWIKTRVPLDDDVQKLVAQSYSDTAVSVIWSTLAAATTQAVLMFVAFLSLRVPGAFLAAGATFLFAWIPVLGSTPVWLGGAIYLFTQDAWVRLVLMIVAGIVTGGADNVVRPMVLKGRSDMHPLISLIAIFGGIQLFGIFGVFFGPIIIAMLVTLLDIWPAVWARATARGE